MPGAFRAACIPAIIDAGAVFAQDKGSFDPAKGPLFNKDAFEPVARSTTTTARATGSKRAVRGFAYQNQDLSFMKNTRMAGGTNFQFRFEVFNMWNWHMFQGGGQFGEQRVQHRHCEPRLRQVEWRCHTGAHLQFGVRFEF